MFQLLSNPSNLRASRIGRRLALVVNPKVKVMFSGDGLKRTLALPAIGIFSFLTVNDCIASMFVLVKDGMSAMQNLTERQSMSIAKADICINLGIKGFKYLFICCQTIWHHLDAIKPPDFGVSF